MVADRRRLRRLRVVLAACWSSPSSARSIRARATSASSCRSSTRASPRAARGARAHRAVRALQRARRGLSRRSARSPPAGPTWLVAARRVARLDALRAMFLALRARSACSCCCSIGAAAGGDRRAPRTAPAAPLGPSRRHRRQARGAVQRRRLRRRPGRQLAAGALAARALRPVAGAGRRVLLLGRPAQRGLAARRAARGAPHRPAEHDGVHAHPGQRLPGRWPRSAPSLPLALVLLFVRSALSQMDVPTRTAYVMAVVTPAERTGGGELHGGAAQPGRRAQPGAQRRALRRRLDLGAAGRLRRAQDRLRPDALAIVPRRRARGALSAAVSGDSRVRLRRSSDCRARRGTCGSRPASSGRFRSPRRASR